MDDVIILLFIAIIILIFIRIFWKMFRKLLLNSIVGILLLLILRYVLIIKIPMVLHTIIIAALFGIPGVGTLLILHLGGMLC